MCGTGWKRDLRSLLDEIPALRWLPGKSGGEGDAWLPTWIHLADTAGVMERLISDWLPSSVIDAARIGYDLFRDACCFIALTHDIGKMTPLFASRLVGRLPDVRRELERCGVYSLDLGMFDTRRYNSPHALAGAAILEMLGCPKSMTSVIGAHHGKPQETHRMIKDQLAQGSPHGRNYYGCSAPDGCREHRDSPEGRLWASVWRGWLDFALAYAGFDAAGGLPALNRSAQMLVCGTLIMADWIASNTIYFPLIPVDGWGEKVDLGSRVDRAMEELRLPDLWAPNRYCISEADLEEEFGFVPNDIQLALADAAAEGSGGIFILEAPMGSGKTEAALAAAETLASKNGLGGIFFGLPTQATANGIFGRIERWAEHQSEGTVQAIRLAHGMAELNENYRALFHGDAVTNEDGESGGLVAHSWFKGNKQAMLANFVIGTVDQLLMAALKQKHLMLRHLGLAGKVVIIDECHAYDAYMNQYLDMAIRWLGAYRVPVIVLSATLPSSRRSELVKAYLKSFGDKTKSIPDGPWCSSRAYPLLTWTDGLDVRQKAIPCSSDRRRVAIERISDDDLIGRIREAVSAGGCAGVIANTVARAQNIAQTLRDAVPDAEVILFHSHFTMHDRAERERDLLARVGKESTAQSRRCRGR